MDVWCDPEPELAVLQAELAATEESERKRKAVLHYEIGRVQLSVGNEPDAAQAFLRAYQLRPQFRPTLRLAQALYRERTDYKLAVKLLDAEARATRDPLTRVALLRQQARILWSYLGQPGEACAILERAHRIDAADLATLKLQQLLYSIERDADGLRASLLRQLESISDSSLHTALLVGLALLLAPADPKAALDTLRSAEKREPGNLSVLCSLEQLLGAEEQHRDLAEAIVRQAEDRSAGPAWRARQLARAARVHRDQIKDPTAAVELFKRSLEVHTSFSVASDCFELLGALDRPAEAVEVGAQLFDLDDTPAQRAALACQVGDIYRIKLQDSEGAARWYLHCLKWSPTYQPALEGLGWILEAAGEIDQLLQVHRTDLANTHEPQARAQRLYRIAGLLERHGRDTESMEVHREALVSWPGFKPAVSALERLYTRHERWTELLQLFDEELDRQPDRERTQHILETMASIWYHQLDSADNAIECYRRILGKEPNHLSTLRSTARLCAVTRRWHDLVELTEREIRLINEPRRQVQLLHRTGEVWEDQLLNLERAMDCYRRALDIDPRHLPALKALGRLYRQKARWADLIQMHRGEIEATEDIEQVVSLLYDIAEIYEEQLLDEDRAAATYREILLRKAGHRPAVAALARILRRRPDWAGLVELLEASLDGVTDDQGRALLLWRMGTLREEQLKDAGGAIKDYTHALRLAPDLAPARAALEQILEEHGDYHQLAELHAAALERCERPSERAAISYRLADLWEHALLNPRKAALLYERALELKPAAWSLWSLSRLYQQLGMAREQCSVLEQLASSIDDAATRAEVQLRIGQIKQSAGLGDPVPHLDAAIEGGVACTHFGHRAIERSLRETGRKAELASILHRRRAVASDPLELACISTELAEVHLQRGDQGAAELAYKEALERSKGHLSALTGLGALLEGQQRWAERAELAEEEAAAMESSAGLAEALTRAAILWEERVGEIQRAVPLYRRVLQIQPGHEVAFRRLRDLLGQGQDWAGLASLIRAQITTTQDPAATSEMFIELGRLYLDHLDQRRKGEACLRRALDLEPGNQYALRTLGGIYFASRQTWSQARKMYARLLEERLDDQMELALVCQRLGDIHLAAGDPAAALRSYHRAAAITSQDPALLQKIAQAARGAGDGRAQAAALEQLAGSTHDPEERVVVRKQLAELAVNTLDDDDLAIRALEETLILDPLDIDAIERLAAIYGRASNRSAASQHLQAAVAHHRVELARRPFDLRLFQQLGRIFQWQRQLDRLYCACIVQAQLGELDEVQQRFLWNHHRRCTPAPKGPLSRGRYETLVLPEAVRGPIRDLLSAAGTGLQRRAAVTPASLGLDKGSRVKKSHPLHAICDEIAGLIGGVDFELWTSRTQPDLIAAEMFSKPALILGTRVAQNLITPAERFRIGKALFLIAENALVLRDLSVREIGQLFTALGAAAQPPCALPLPIKQPERVDEETRRVAKLLSRRDRKVLGTLLPKVAEELGRVNLAEFARTLGFGSNRLGLVAAGDPRIALEELAQLAGDPPQGPEMGDMLQYMVSEEYFTLRMELAIAPGSQ